MVLGRRGPLSKAIGNTIGLTREYQADRQSRQDAANLAEVEDQHHEHNEDAESSEDDEAFVQDLDAAQLETIEANEFLANDFDEGSWLENFIKDHPPPPYDAQQSTGPLSMPVIIPERRPGFKTRGFCRAYAPVLEDAGIDEKTWLDFLQGFERSFSKHKYFHVLNVAVFVADKIRLAFEGVSLIAHFVSLAIHLSVEASRRMYMNAEGNKFLDQMNDDFFKPRGLYCMVIKYDPKTDEPDETIDVTTNTIAQVAKRDDDARSAWKNLFQGSAGKVKHEEEIPEFAPLVFPQLDNLDPDKKENAIKHFGSFLGEYYDRRGQAKFDSEHEGSKLAGVTGEKQFASRYSDPNHPASTGGLIQTISGGRIQHRGPVQKLGTRINARRNERGVRPVGGQARKDRRARRPTRRFLKQDVLYLMVVNLPNREEMERVVEALEEKKKEEASKGKESGGLSQFSVEGLRKALGL